MTVDASSARTVMERCDILGGYSEEPGCLTRPFASPAMQKANEAVAAWMQAAGMTVQQDKVGNLIGRYEASQAGAKTLLLGSHLDSVRDAGKYDGPLGVMIALACVERLNARKERLPFAIEVLGFADEEGLRYHSAYIGSKVVTGTFDPQALHLTDAEGITMAEAIHAFGGDPDPDALQTARWHRDELLAYCEVHIEQGPVLEARNLPVAVVSAIAGQNRISVRFASEAGHAGTVPMSLRRDALCAAAEFVLAVEAVARSLPGLVATVGQVSVQPGASNVIPGQVTLSLDVRHQDDTVREQACRQLEERTREIGEARRVSSHWQILQGHSGVPCAPHLTRLLAQAIEEMGYPLLSLPSGAGHDAATLSELTDIAMLFVRCRGGISHNPAESVTVEDVEVAIQVLERFLLLLRVHGRGAPCGYPSPQYDLIVRNGTLVTATGVSNADLAIVDGRIVAIAPDLVGTSKEEINAEGLHVFPGVIDAHVHFNEPGRTAWEGFATGTAALAAGGTTAFFDMPLNSSPPTIDAESFDLKLKAAQASSLVDFALWGGLVPGNLAHLDELADRGVIGFKAFMSNSGIDDFSSVDDLTLYEGMARAAQLGKIVALHAESDQITGALARRAIAQGRTGIRDYLTSRPVIAELEAIQRAILFAQETGCALHIVHVSSGRGIGLVAEARARGIDVSCETCTHYLVLTEDDVEELGAVAKCAPPLRPQTEQDALWQQLFDGNIPMVTSDHSPAPADMKTSSDFFKVWGGISGCQSLLQLLLTEGYDRRQLPLTTIAAITAENVARRFGLLPGKGCLTIGADADLVLVDLSSSITLQRSDLFYRHQHSPYVGRMLQGRIMRTLVRGRTVFLEGKLVSAPSGRLLRPLPRQEV